MERVQGPRQGCTGLFTHVALADLLLQHRLGPGHQLIQVSRPGRCVDGIVRAEETDPTRVAAIDGDPFTESDAAQPLFRVVDDSAPALLALVPDRGSIDGGEQVLLLGDGFLGADNQPNVYIAHFDESGTSSLPANLDLAHFKLYPNPAIGTIKVDVGGEKPQPQVSPYGHAPSVL